MEIKVITDEKHKLVFEVPGVSHGFCTMLKKQLLEDSHVKIATYAVEHPLVNTPKFQVETDTSTTPKQAVAAAIKKLQSFAEKTKKDLLKDIK